MGKKLKNEKCFNIDLQIKKKKTIIIQSLPFTAACIYQNTQNKTILI